MQARQGEVDESAVHAKLIRRIVPFLFVCYVPAGFLTGRAAAGGIAMIVSIGNLGGFVGPFMIGQIKDLTPELHGAAHRGRVLPSDWLRPDDCLRPPRSSGCRHRAAPGRRLTGP
jgi:hypothetical protein